MKDNSLKALEIVKEVRNSDWNFERREILEKAVKELLEHSLSQGSLKGEIYCSHELVVK